MIRTLTNYRLTLTQSLGLCGPTIGTSSNADKGKIMTVGRAYSRLAHICNLPIGSGNQDIIRVSQEKDLGVLIVSDLNFENHILSKVKTGNRIIGLIKRNFKNMDFQRCLLFHKSLIRSHLEYAETVWSPFRSKLIEAVEKLQKRATKILLDLVNSQDPNNCMCDVIPHIGSLSTMFQNPDPDVHWLISANADAGCGQTSAEEAAKISPSAVCTCVV